MAAKKQTKPSLKPSSDKGLQASGSKRGKKRVVSWKDVTPIDPSEILLGSEEGGFIGLEELDAAVYDANQKEFLQSDPTTEAPDLGTASHSNEKLESKKAKKSKKEIQFPKTTSDHLTVPENSNQADEGLTPANDDIVEKDPEAKPVKKKKKKKQKKLKKKGGNQADQSEKNDSHKLKGEWKSEEKDDADGKLLEDKFANVDVSAWDQLRLNPKIIQAIRMLGFKEPTPIQIKCIPLIAHKGMHLVGAAETGSGKTLAFGIPIIQRLLDDREKEERLKAESSNLAFNPEEEQNNLNPKEQENDIGNGGSRRNPKRNSPLRALIITPTRELALQICSHLKVISSYAGVQVVALVGGISILKQQRLLRLCPEIVVGTPGRLWELMSMGESHLLQLNYLSFFILDEADRLVQKGHYKELQSIIDWLPRIPKPEKNAKNKISGSTSTHYLHGRQNDLKRKRKRNESEYEDEDEIDHENEVSDDAGEEVNGEESEKDEMKEDGEEENEEEEEEVLVDDDDIENEGDEVEDVNIDEEAEKIEETRTNGSGNQRFLQMKKRQILVFSATLSVPPEFRKKLKSKFQANVRRRGKNSDSENTVENIINHLGMDSNVEVVDLTPSTILARKVEQAVIECTESDKDMMLYYILRLYSKGRILIFCTSISSLKRLSSLLKTLGMEHAFPLHAKMQQRQRLRYLERFKSSENGILVATDVAARGLDIPYVKTVVHYQLPHSSEIYVHRSGRTARAGTEGLSLAILSPKDTLKYKELLSALNLNQGLKKFPIDVSYLPQIRNCLSLAVKVEGLLHRMSKVKAHHGWVKKSKSLLDISSEDDGESNSNPDSRLANLTKREMAAIRSLQNQLRTQVQMPLQQMGFSKKYISKGGLSSLQVEQLQEFKKIKNKPTSSPPSNPYNPSSSMGHGKGLVVIGRLPTEALQALKSSDTPNKENDEGEKDTENVKDQKKGGYRNKRKKFRYHK